MNNHTYDITKDITFNGFYGPFWEGDLPEISESVKTWKFLDTKLKSPFGISACPLMMNARFINLHAKLGFDLLTYKTVRSHEWHGNEFPHWKYVDIDSQMDNEQKPELKANFESFNNSEVSMTNSFGVQSVKPEYWQADVNQSVDLLGEGKSLILSLMVSEAGGRKIYEDADYIGNLAAETDAQYFEINLSCPNTEAGQGMIYEDVEVSRKVIEILKKSLVGKHLLAKVGYYQDKQVLKHFFESTKDILSGVTTMNTMSAKVVENGETPFPGRETAGVSGYTIKDLALEQAKDFVALRDESDVSDYVVIGVGGVTKPNHISEYLEVGVDAVQSAVGAYEDPMLAVKYKKLVGGSK